MEIRAMTHDDVPAVERVTAAAFHDIDVRTLPADWPAPEPRSPARAVLWLTRLRHLVTHDGPGCWVAEAESGELVGAVAALQREGLWGLSTYAVQPDLQARGVGKALLDAALGYGPRDAPGIICSSHDPRAVRRYRLAGFDLHPTMFMVGKVNRAALPRVTVVRQGGVEDIPLLDEIDRATRGAGHGVDHEVMIGQYPLVVTEQVGRRGYAYLYSTGAPYLLAATDAASAETLMWAALATTEPTDEVDFSHLTSQHGWAIDIGLRVGLDLHSRGYLALRAMDPAPTYIPSGHFL